MLPEACLPACDLHNPPPHPGPLVEEGKGVPDTVSLL